MSSSVIKSSPCQCWCENCRPLVLDDMRMILCPTCGNKRCPKASDHRNECTDSNEPGQAGSRYPRIEWTLPVKSVFDYQDEGG